MMSTDTLRYFDYAATTPADPRVMEAMFGCLGAAGVFGNPASNSHAAGLKAKDLVEQARAQVAALIGAEPSEIVWTSGATESNNLALKGFFDCEPTRRHLVTSKLEHKAILDTASYLERLDVSVSYLLPDPSGEISPAAVEAACSHHTGLVSLMMVNNEIGTLTNIAEISRLVHAAGALLHVDAAQAVGKTAIDVKAMGVDLLSMSAHKVYGPKGIGALYVSREVASRIACQMHGGGHEQGLRSGTLATHQIVGMGTACELARTEMASDNERIAQLSERLLSGVRATGAITQNVSSAVRIPHTLSLTVELPNFFPSMLADDLAISSTSACNSAAGKPSHVLTGIGLGADSAERTVRLSLGRFTTEADVDFAVDCFRGAIERCREAGAGRQDMQIRQLSNDVSVAPQLSGADVRAAHAIGFRSIVCNRHDGEAAGQTQFAKIAEVASSLGMAAHYLPVESGDVTVEAAAAFGLLVAELPKPVLAYCRTGTRSATLWNLASSRQG
ncbi:class V aminotransferase [Cupriavidus sp. SHE]|uniref:cysteine desulfurase n=1 Tax=Cupriavidus metallidurans TaxID=119219 RepID=A0A482J207_9BURK|nr:MULTISPECIES: aminotransferase class V-fold PLP-dependent enzyme [Cupriavidus]KWR85584.1 class V aminotransferase [Cupriavidus sp. SHE]QBP13164.1 TIGR01244 family phosphatase [Cupriavidus metallidurans]